MTPTWERGYRCHGFWIGTVRWGWVGLGPAGCTRVKRDGYTWGFSPHGIVKNRPTPDVDEGTARTLREGKRRVEAAFRAWAAGKPAEAFKSPAKCW